MLQVHRLWREYIKDLVFPAKQQLTPKDLQANFEKNKMNILQKIAKCDLHGAIVSVFESKVKSLIGTEGIILKESRQTFTVI